MHIKYITIVFERYILETNFVESSSFCAIFWNLDLPIIIKLYNSPTLRPTS